jgi:adenylate cyclase
LRNDVVWHADDAPVAFRIGINLGDVLVDEEANVQGRSVNVAARIQALAPPRGICLSAAVQHVVDQSPDLTLRSLGHQSLKNIAEPVEVFVVEQGTSPPAMIELPAHPAVLPPAEASVAVLPLANLSGDPRDIHLCDGITGDIITNLSRFRDLLVIARHSTFLFKDARVPPKVIGDRLGVRYLLTGGLQRDRSRIRINVELSEILSGKVIWAERLKGDLGDVFAFQDDVTDVIAARLAVQITAAERRRALSAAPPDLRAYGLVLRAHELSIRLRQEENLHARRLFEQAAELDPGYGRTYAGLSLTFKSHGSTSGKDRRKLTWTGPSNWPWRRSTTTVWTRAAMPSSDTRIFSRSSERIRLSPTSRRSTSIRMMPTSSPTRQWRPARRAIRIARCSS